jgi:hypothetical protein
MERGDEGAIMTSEHLIETIQRWAACEIDGSMSEMMDRETRGELGEILSQIRALEDVAQAARTLRDSPTYPARAINSNRLNRALTALDAEWEP